jgi:hypothetical protein
MWEERAPVSNPYRKSMSTRQIFSERIDNYKNLKNFFFIMKHIEVTDETHSLVRIVAAFKKVYVKDWVAECASRDAQELGLISGGEEKKK